jgi:GTP diphosphokinase / guanosine-3',5'-bis(diphosphate) 3'-diphosphatase
VPAQKITNPVERLAHAVEFAAQKHIDQRRKGERAEPYVNHVAEVARLLAHATRGRDPNLVIAGLLHDTLEDTDTTYRELVRHFGKDVSDLVREVTDNKRHRWRMRKRLQIEEAPHKSRRARMLKIADKTANLRSLEHSAPVEWTEQRRDNYYVWAAKVVDACRGVSPYLEREFDKAYAKRPKA